MTTLHAYGVVSSSDTTWPVFGAGLGGSAVEVLGLRDDMGVLVSRLSGELADPDVWREHADDVPWLGEVATAHHAVLQEAAVLGDVVPLRLPGLYPDEAALRRAFRDRIEALDEAMTRVRGRWEWAAKVYGREMADGSENEPVAVTSGRDYLGRRIEEKRAKEFSAGQLRSTLAGVVDRLSSGAVEVVQNPPQDPALSGRPEPMLLNAAVLVERSQSADFVADTDRCSDWCADKGLLLEVTGPLPPYNFTQLGS